MKLILMMNLVESTFFKQNYLDILVLDGQSLINWHGEIKTKKEHPCL
jgi:hypothetical protein